MVETAANRYLLPWLYDELDRTRRVLGPAFWPSGLDPNRGPLEVFLRYAQEQGLTGRRLVPDELFVPETRESYVI